MSGICGAWSDESLTPDLTPVLASLGRRGPDRTGKYRNGSVALGHTLLATTPEALCEILPLTDQGSGCTITADCRLDNRDELLAALETSARSAGDGELILLAYLKWGDDCPQHLLGDFAFAIWDPRTERMFCARDHMGMRQILYHHTPGRLFAFATEAEALVAHPHVPSQLNHGRVADFLDGLEGIDFTSTFYQHVSRLPPAHILIADLNGLRLRRYWRLRAGTELTLSSDQEYVSAFLKVLSEAVRCRLRSARPVGAMLSGGLDSNSIAAIAGGQLAAAGQAPLRTFSSIDRSSADCAESAAIRLAIESDLFSPTLICRDRPAEWLPDVLLTTEQCAEPFDAYLVISKAIYGAARRQNLNVVLDGVGADVVLTAGNRVAGLLRTVGIRAAIKEARLEGRFWGSTWQPRKIFVSALWTAFAPDFLRRIRRKLGWWAADQQMRMGRDCVTREFATAVNLSARRRRSRHYLPTSVSYENGYRVQSVQHPHLVAARERYDRVASAFGVEPRDPFMDIRVIQFVLSLPSSQLQADGWPKLILRRSIEGIIPRAIAWRRGKSHVGWAFMTKLISYWRSRPPDQTSILPLLPLIGKNLRSKLRIDEKNATWLKLFILARWLDRRAIDSSKLGS